MNRNVCLFFLLALVFVSASVFKKEEEVFTEEQQAKIDAAADKKYTWIKKSLQKQAQKLDAFDFVKEEQKKLAEQMKVKEEARKYATAKNQKIAEQRLNDMKYYYPYLAQQNKDDDASSSGPTELPIYLDDGSWSAYLWSFAGYPTRTKLDTSNPLTQYYLQNKQSSIKLDTKTKQLYLAVEKY